jgi:hypothetical protein
LEPTSPPPAKASGFGRLLIELIETERSYQTGLEQLLTGFRPALQPLAPTVLTPLFESIGAIHRTSEELLGRLEHVQEICMNSREIVPGAGSMPIGRREAMEREVWAAAALAEAFRPPTASLREHPLSRYRAFVNHFDAGLSALSSLMGVPAFDSRVRQVTTQLRSTRTLNDLLITPVQRPPRYLMLLESAEKAFAKAAAAATAAAAAADGDGAQGAGSGESPFSAAAAAAGGVEGAGAALRAAVEVVRAAVLDLNEAKRESDGFNQVSEVQRRLGTFAVALEHPCRRFVAEGQLQCLTRSGEWSDRVAILLNDVLLLCSHRWEAKEARASAAPLSLLSFGAVTGASRASSAARAPLPMELVCSTPPLRS